jgi:hypothetical protein
MPVASCSPSPTGLWEGSGTQKPIGLLTFSKKPVDEIHFADLVPNRPKSILANLEGLGRKGR